MTLNLSFYKAHNLDAEPLTMLINSAYRGDYSRKGWTTEAGLLEGRRTDIEEVLHLIADDDSMFIVCKADSELQGSVHLQNTEEGVYIGMFAVNPTLQDRGIGKALLQAAELAAQQSWSVNRFVMVVISCRHELIAFYERRGYRRTGINKAFPVNPTLWTPKVSDLELVILEKTLLF
jgi:ribosomal protein S18 acetylase RimI-like enzyme